MKVAVGIVLNKARQVLITQRALTLPHGGKWEFPGGKLEQEETALHALHREIHEEVGLQIIKADFLCDIEHDYGNKHVHLYVYVITQFKGLAVCSESQLDLRWVFIDELTDYDFPEANKEIINKLNQLEVKNSAYAE